MVICILNMNYEILVTFCANQIVSSTQYKPGKKQITHIYIHYILKKHPYIKKATYNNIQRKSQLTGCTTSSIVRRPVYRQRKQRREQALYQTVTDNMTIKQPTEGPSRLTLISLISLFMFFNEINLHKSLQLQLYILQLSPFKIGLVSSVIFVQY